MKPFVNYIIETGLSLGVFTLTYWFLLRRENRFRANRFYLLGALLFSTLLPFLTIRISFFDLFGAIRDLTINPRRGTILLETVTVYASGFPAKLGQAILSFNYSLLIYLLGAIAALFFIAAGLFQLAIMVSKNRVFRLKRAKLVVSQREISPYSFFNFIFIGKDLTTQENWKSMVQHEMVHVKQGHSFDVLFIDFMMIFQWFNPFYWIIRRMVRENHEFLADSGVLSKGAITPGRYKALLLSQAIGGIPVITSNFFNVKSIQKRFKMMSKNKKGKLGFLKYSLSIIAAVVIVLLFACENKANKISSNQTQEKKEVINEPLPVKQEVATKEQNENSSVTVVTSEPKKKTATEQIPVKKEVAKKIESTVESEVINPDDEATYVIVENPACFQGGDLNEFRTWVQKNLVYPAIACEKGIQGKVYVQFAVTSKGDVVDIKVLRSADPSLDDEAIRVIKSSPKWTPAKQSGKNVKQEFVIPLNFVLQ